jgi:protein O-mannosyl-transferase
MAQTKSDSDQPVELWRRDWVLSLILMVVTMVAYLPAWHGTPIWDDDAHLTKPELRSLEGLARIWTQPGATQQYYPLVHSLFWGEHQLWGDWPLGYHLVNILLHSISALLLVKILRLLEIPGAWLAAAIFTLHPIQVESVAWISELKNMLSGVFYFSSVFAYLKFDRTKKLGPYVIALVLFVLGLMSKTVIATLPPPR